jgi:translation elongation factor EF-Tu-like GTPase
MIYIETNTTWLTADVGGRANPTAVGYRPHIIVVGDMEMLGVIVVAGPETINPGETATIQLACVYYPRVDYGKLQQGTQFLIVEGRRVVAVGKVMRRWEEGE